MKQVRGDNIGVQRKPRSHRAGSCQFFQNHDAEQKVGACTPVLFGYGGAQQAILAGFMPDLPADLTFFFPPRVMGYDVSINKMSD